MSKASREEKKILQALGYMKNVDDGFYYRTARSSVNDDVIAIRKLIKSEVFGALERIDRANRHFQVVEDTALRNHRARVEGEIASIRKEFA